VTAGFWRVASLLLFLNVLRGCGRWRVTLARGPAVLREHCVMVGAFNFKHELMR